MRPRALTLKVVATALASLLAVAALGAPAAPAARTPAGPRCVPTRLDRVATVVAGHLTVSPSPHSYDALPGTQISIVGTPASTLTMGEVLGSRSGAHAFRVLPYSQGDGISVVPVKPLVSGEIVTVAGTRTLGGRRTPFAWRFTVAYPITPGGPGSSTPTPKFKPAVQYFNSRPDLQPPPVAVTVHSSATAPGYVLAAPYAGPGQAGPMIFDTNGQLVWFSPVAPGAQAADLRVQTYDGAPVLTWWSGSLLGGHYSAGAYTIADSSYRVIRTVRAGNGRAADLHELLITPAGTGLMTVFSSIACDLSSVHGPRNGAVWDAMVQEIDLATGLVRKEWHGIDHIGLDESYWPSRPGSAAIPFDFMHLNSIDLLPNGRWLLSARNTWALYEIDPRSGSIVWRLGGKRTNFTLGHGTGTAWQHDARLLPNGQISLFDNGSTPRVHPQSRGILLNVDSRRKRVSLGAQVEHPSRLSAESQGNFQALPQGGWFVGWGQVPYFSEFDAAGHLLFDAHLPSYEQSYRGYLSQWHAQPTAPPDLALRAAANGQRIAYASWNGATEVASWRLLAGPSAAALGSVSVTPRSGFETAMTVPAGAGGAFEVQALDASGRVLGTSAPAAG